MNLFSSYVKKSSYVFDLSKKKFNEEQVPFKIMYLHWQKNHRIPYQIPQGVHLKKHTIRFFEILEMRLITPWVTLATTCKS
jgi:hypothetical protein